MIWAKIAHPSFLFIQWLFVQLLDVEHQDVHSLPVIFVNVDDIVGHIV